MKFLIILLAPFTLAPDDASDRYLDCLVLIEEDVQVGRRAAQLWAEEGGGANAQHCQAIADLAAGFTKLGAARLEDLSQRKDAGDDLVRARIYVQAAEAWLRAEATDNAERAIAAAFELAPDAGELHLTAASIHLAAERYTQVIAAVDTAEQAGFISTKGFIERGKASLATGNAEAAAEDVVNALTLEPYNIDALTLRGDVQRAGITIDVALGTPRQ